MSLHRPAGARLSRSASAIAAPGQFLLANGRGATVDATSSLARAPYIAVAELTGTAAQGRILLAAPIAQEDIEARFAEQIEDRQEISFDRGAMALRGASQADAARDHAVGSAGRAVALGGDRADFRRTAWSPPGSTGLPWSKALKQWRDRVMFLRKAEGDSWPDLSDAALAARCRELAGAGAIRQDRAEGAFARRPLRRRDGAVAVGIARAAGARGADAFRGADRHHAGDRLRSRAGADHLRSACRNCSGSTPIPRSPRARCRWCWNCCRRRNARCR